jgi:hypothetical protein
MHLFAAGVVLCLLVRDYPSSKKSQENKMGLHRILKMATTLKDTSELATQGLVLIRKLIALVFKNKAGEFFRVEAHGKGSEETHTLDVYKPNQCP